MNVEYRILTLEDYNHVCKLFECDQMPDQVLDILFKLKKNELIQNQKSRAFLYLKSDLSFGAFAADKLVGISLNTTNSQINETKDPSIEVSNMLRFLIWFKNRKPLTFNPEKNVTLNLGNVSHEYSKQGIYTKLVSSSLNHAKKMGLECVTAVSTSTYAHKTFDKLHFEIADEILYSEYYDPVLQIFPFKLHQDCNNSARIYYKLL